MNVNSAELLFGHMIGSTESAARRVAKLDGCVVRVVQRDSAPSIVTSDHVENRVNVEVVNGRVSRIVGFG